MAGWLNRARMKRIVSLMALSFFLMGLCSCSPVEVLVVNNPYIEVIQGHPWAATRPLFALRARLQGLKITTLNISENEDLPSILKNSDKIPATIVLTPAHAGSIAQLASAESRIVLVGGYAQESTAVYSIAPDRTGVIGDLAKLSSKIAKDSDLSILAVFRGATGEEKREIDAFKRELSADINVQFISLAEMPGRSLPSDFSQRINRHTLLILLAGSENIPAMRASEEEAVPVITEFVRGADAWKNRIVASVEDDNRQMMRTLLHVLKSDNPKLVHNYPSRMEKGVLYEEYSR